MAQIEDRLKAAMPALLCGLPATLLLFAHFSSGAEAGAYTALYTSLILAIALVIPFSLPAARTPLVSLLLFAILAVAGVSGLIGNWFQAREEYCALIAAAGIWSTGHALGAHGELRHHAYRALIISLCVFAIVMLLLAATTRHSQDADIWWGARFTGSFASPNVLATLYGIAVCCGLSQILADLRRRWSQDLPRRVILNRVFRRRFLAFLLVASASAGLLLTASRAGIGLTLIISAAMVAVQIPYLRTARDSERRAQRQPILTSAIVAALLICMGWVFYTTTSPALDVRSGSIVSDGGGRLDVYRTYWEIWQEKFWFGYGLGGFNTANDMHVTLENAPSMIDMGAAHNVLLQWLIQTGLVGTSILVAVVCALHAPIIRAAFVKTPHTKTVILCAISVSALVILHGMIDYALEIPSIMWTYAFILGLGAGNAREIFRDRAEAAKTPEDVPAD